MKRQYGCIVWILSAFKNPAGVPSTVPMDQIVDGTSNADLSVSDVVDPAETLTCGGIGTV